jgi:alanyl-tRNA synthetase
MTERLYHADSSLREFTARVVKRTPGERGPVVVLDRTAFYPTSGGQPHDTGTLDEIAVLDVWEDDDGAVAHLLERVPDGDEVRGVIDWERRFDHMQQHTGQHLLSAGFVHLLAAPTVSFHLGSEDSTIDLNVPELDWESAFRVEADVNRVIWENRPVEVHVVDEADIHTMPLRRPPKVRGTIRVIWIKGYEAAACGGTHVQRTGAVGVLKITRLERYKGGIRVGFLCGGRALADYQRVLRTVQEASADLSVHPGQLVDAVGRLRSDAKEASRAARAAENALMALEAERLWRETAEVDGVRRVVAYFADRTFDQARAIAAHACSRSRTLALLAVGDAKGVRLVCQRSDDLPHLDAADILSRAAHSLGGRAGGMASLAQGGAPAVSEETVLRAMRDVAEGRMGG